MKNADGFSVPAHCIVSIISIISLNFFFDAQVAVASEDIPSNLAEAEKLLSDHKGIKEDITAHQEDHAKMLDLADKFVKGQEEDPQYLLLRERIKALDDGWRELHKMWDNRQNLLSQASPTDFCRLVVGGKRERERLYIRNKCAMFIYI